MLSKMAQPNNIGGAATATSGRRIPLSLSSGVGSSSSSVGGSTVSKLQQAAIGSNGRSKSPQNSKKNEPSLGPFVSMKKLGQPQRSSSTSSTASTSSSKDEEKKSQNGVSKTTNNQKSTQNGSGAAKELVKEQQQKVKESKEQSKEQQKAKETKELAKEQQKAKDTKEPKEKPIEIESKDESKPSKKDVGKDIKVTAEKVVESEIIEIDNEPIILKPEPSTPERKSSRRVAGQQKSPQQQSPQQKTPQQKTPQEQSPQQKTQQQKSPQQSVSLAQKKQPEDAATEAVVDKAQADDVEMESLTVDASPIRCVGVTGVQPTATSTPGRNLFGFRKQSNEVEVVAQPSSSPSITPAARSFAQISGRRSIRPLDKLTPGKLGSYRCINTSELDNSSCTNASMNATVGSEIPNNSSFSFSFFNRGRKRERTPPPLTGSQSTNDMAQDVEMSPPKRARFDLFSLSLSSPFTMLRSRFSKASISTPSSRQRLETPPTGDDDEEVGDEVQNLSDIVIQEDEEVQQLNRSATNNEVTVGQEAGLETPKKRGNDLEDQDEQVDDIQGDVEVTDIAAIADADQPLPVESEETNRSRCAIM